jgi:hypothetical protein
VLGVDERAGPTQLLCLRNDVGREGGLARRFRPKNLGDPAPRHSSHAEGIVKGKGTGRDGLHILMRIVTEAHDRALSVLPLDLLNGEIEGLFLCFSILV